LAVNGQVSQRVAKEEKKNERVTECALLMADSIVALSSQT
jgi:hypothetical protein